MLISTGMLGLVPKLNEPWKKDIFNKDKEYKSKDYYGIEVDCKGVWEQVD